MAAKADYDYANTPPWLTQISVHEADDGHYTGLLNAEGRPIMRAIGFALHSKPAQPAKPTKKGRSHG